MTAEKRSVGTKMLRWLSHDQQSIAFQQCMRQVFTGIAGIHEPTPNFAGIKVNADT